MHSPRFLAVWTMAYIGRVNFLGKKDSLGAVQYTILRYLPTYIAWEAAVDHLIRRQLVVTLDDVIWLVLYIIANDCENQQLQNDENIPLNSYFFQQQPQADSQDPADPTSKPTEKKTEEDTKVPM